MYKKILSCLLLAISVLNVSYVSTAQAATTQTGEREVSFYIKEMTCQLCVYLVNKELRALDGVVKTKADMNAHTVKIIAKPTVTNQQLIQAIEKLHYTAQLF
ncbi:heavy-metal-associated domain-containing protein [Gallibacterium salpingitidis]|uniref:HMA domain-containing protein n=1 Tax=Gallibacterium salpingitidis TaxID=505341 RepID=A0A1A7P1Y4_9PAST|nr:heavy-metal-associated domain-containing protein [Gallibacterium salpingitidis]OBW96013.1 hypothetical protein QS62_01980 [Gallibacterium salpingitidis]